MRGKASQGAGWSWSLAGLGAGGKGKELGVPVLAEFHQSVTTVPVQSHQWPARGDSTAAGQRLQEDLHLGTPQADATGLESSRDEEKPWCCCRSVFHLSLPETSEPSHCAITGGF